MKKALKIISLSLVGILFLIIVISTINFSRYWAKDSEIDISEQNLKYFHESYQECRSSFQQAATKVSNEFNSVAYGKLLIDSNIDTNLTINWCYIPAQNHTSKLVIINSGLHGIEGYTGSAIQLMFLEKILPDASLDSMGVLLIHGINPYGFKYKRKVTENNIDLNRNCVVDKDMFLSKNEGYKKLRPLLMPEGSVNINSFRNRFFHLSAIRKIIQESMPALRQAALQGQYEFEKGIYYGGKNHEPQILQLKTLLTEKMDGYNIILNVDLHTAYGRRGAMHLFLNPVDDNEVKTALLSVFKDEKIDWGSGKDFYTINGEYLSWVNSIADNALHIPMLFEFGTLDSQKTFGSLKSIQVMINENQGYQYGYVNAKSEEKAKALFNEMYYPSSPAWRSKVIDDSFMKMSAMIKNFQAL